MHDKVALVTGAAGGIGRASALAFAEAGAQVTVADLNLGGAEETAHLIVQAGGQAIALGVNVTDAEAVGSMVRRTLDEFGRLDFAHNNAGIAYAADEIGPIHEQSAALWQRIIDVNLTGVWHCLQRELPVMIAGGGGAIVNTSSTLGLKASPGYSANLPQNMASPV